MKFGFAEPRTVSTIMLLIGALVAGCADGEQYEQQSNLRAIAAYYSQYLAHNRGQSPANEEDFKNFIKAKEGEALSYNGLSVDELFISSRDGKPLVVKYRGDKSWPLPDVVAYEQEGRAGTRHIATIFGGYEIMSEEEFRSQKLAPAAAK